MFDTHAIARQLANADLTPAQRADLATLRADIYRAMLIQTAATIGGTVALLPLLG